MALARFETRAHAAGLLLAALGAGAVRAQPAEVSPWSFSLTSATEYVSKGTGKSDGDPHLAVGVERALGRLAYSGAWAGNARTSQGSDAEAHLYLGVRPRVGGTRFDFRVFYKNQPGAEPGVQEDFLELRADVSRSSGAAQLRVRTEYSPDGYALTRQAWWFEAEAGVPVTDRLSASAGYGVREQEGGVDYNAWNLGAEFELTDALTLELRWFDTSAHGRGEQYDGRAVGSANFRF